MLGKSLRGTFNHVREKPGERFAGIHEGEDLGLGLFLRALLGRWNWEVDNVGYLSLQPNEVLVHVKLSQIVDCLPFSTVILGLRHALTNHGHSLSLLPQRPSKDMATKLMVFTCLR